MYYDFIEIGTADFDTEIQNHEGRKGISVDIIQEYLDNLPNIKNVTKVCCGISNKCGEVIAYVPKFPSSFPSWFRGCVSIIKPHPHLISGCQELNVNYSDYLEIRKVPIITAGDFIKKYNIIGLDYLKVDTEGHDCIILNSWLDYSLENNIQLPKRILYESKDLTDEKELEAMRNRLISLK
jgi:hypothetical protein